jgi:DNA-binding Lrp family transcriptional regulator
MDRTDVSLCLLLMMNSRTPYHELAAKLGLSINAVHKRVGAMSSLGIIRTFAAHQSLFSLGAVSAWVFGRSEASRLSDIQSRLKTDDRTYWVAKSGGGYIYVGGYLRDISELDGYATFVKKEGEMSDPTVGIIAMPGSRPTGEVLRPLDYQILASLSKNSRKPATEVAAEVRASAKSVNRRLEWMMEKRLADLTIDWYPDASNDVVALCHVTVVGPFDRMKVLGDLRQRFQPNMLVDVVFGNLPNLLVLFLWTNSMRQMEGIGESMGAVEGVGSVTLNVLQVGYMFDTWRDKLVLKNAGPTVATDS